MKAKVEIALSVPDSVKSGRYFSLKLKSHLVNEPSEFCSPRKILAVSDIEGNFRPFCKLLIRNKVINKYFDWTFDDNHLVIVGDCFDRGEQVTECLWLIYMLEDKAAKKGGKVHFILGNHEIMNLNGDWRYVHPKYAVSTKSDKGIAALYGGNSELWNWLLTKNIIEKIGDIIFVHGGIAGDLIRLNANLSELHSKIRPYYTRASNLFTDQLLQIVFNSENSPFWYRGFYNHETKVEEIDAVLDHFGASTIVTGHTVVDQIKSYFEGKVINIDTDHAAGISEALLIQHNYFYRVDTRGKRTKLK